MAIINDPRYVPLHDPHEPDTARPASTRATVVDPVAPDGHYVRDLVLIFQRMAPGHGHPRHRHSCDEAIVIDAGTAEVSLGDERRAVGPGAVAFVPAGAPHNIRNAGKEELRFHVIFPAAVIATQPLDSDQGAGAPASPPFIQDMRAWAASQEGGATVSSTAHGGDGQ